MAPNLDDDRYHDLLELYGNLNREFQEFKQELTRQQLEHWKAVSIAIRTFTDWWTIATDDDRRERKERQLVTDQRARWRLGMEIALLVSVVALALIVLLR